MFPRHYPHRYQSQMAGYPSVIGATSPTVRAALGDRIRAVGDAFDPNPNQGPQPMAEFPSWYYALTLAGTAIGAYHGYKRNDSIGWAIGWGILGSIFPVIVIPVAFAQGIDKKA